MPKKYIMCISWGLLCNRIAIFAVWTAHEWHLGLRVNLFAFFMLSVWNCFTIVFSSLSFINVVLTISFWIRNNFFQLQNFKPLPDFLKLFLHLERRSKYRQCVTGAYTIIISLATKQHMSYHRPQVIGCQDRPQVHLIITDHKQHVNITMTGHRSI